MLFLAEKPLKLRVFHKFLPAECFMKKTLNFSFFGAMIGLIGTQSVLLSFEKKFIFEMI